MGTFGGFMVRSIGRILVNSLTIAGVAAATPAHAAGCWSEGAIAAAKVRELETMLMVSALRRRLSGNDFLPARNAFVAGSRPTLVAVNERLRRHFRKTVGAGQGLNAYDRYVTSIANSYGAGVGGLDCADMASILDAAVAAGHSGDALETLADRTAVSPALSGGRCEIVIAGAE